MIDLLTQMAQANVIHHFFGRALLAGVGVAFLAGFIGCFLSWRRLAFFGDALGHGALLGVVLGLILQIETTVSVIIFSLLVAAFLARLNQIRTVSGDTWLAVISYGSLSLGLIFLSFFPRIRLDPSSILFGDILSVTQADLSWLWALIPVMLTLFLTQRRALLMATIDPDLAFVSGISVKRTEAILMLSVALTTAVGLKSMGGLLLPALFVMPAASAAQLARTPEGMIGFATAIAVFTTLVGLFVSFYINVPTGPAIVCLNALFLVLVTVFRRPFS